MKVFENGKYREATDEDFAQNHDVVVIETEYKDRVINRIRAVYSVDDELAILRQRDTKPDEFAEYNAFVEKVKAEEKEFGEV